MDFSYDSGMTRLAQNTMTIGVSAFDRETDSTKAMVESLRECGAEPLVLTLHEQRNWQEDIEQITALVVMGNDFDIDPTRYLDRYAPDDPRRQIHPATKNEMNDQRARARALYEEEILRAALSRKMPILGVCGGMQRLNVLLGGTLHQHVPDIAGHEKHQQRSLGIEPRLPILPIVVEGGTLLADIASDIRMAFCSSNCKMSPKVILENSLHHQAIDLVAPGLRASALCDEVKREAGRTNYMIKAIEAEPAGPYGGQFLLGVQWHPEFGASPLGKRIAQRLVDAASQFKAH